MSPSQVAVAVKRSKAAAAEDQPTERGQEAGEDRQAAEPAPTEAAPVGDGPAAGVRPEPAVPVAFLTPMRSGCGSTQEKVGGACKAARNLRLR